MIYKIPLTLWPQPEGGFTVTSSALPELITEGDTAEEALANVSDAIEAILEAFEDLGRPIPECLHPTDASTPVSLETLVTVP